MDKYFVTIGGFNIKISFQDYDYDLTPIKNRIEVDLLIYLRNFLTTTPPKKIDFEITFLTPLEPEIFTLKDKQSLHLTTLFYPIARNKIATYSQISIYQFERILKNVIFILLSQNKGFGIHASSIVMDGKAHLFLGESGAGKSTIVELARNKFQVLSDDVIYIRNIKNKYYSFQAPFFEKAWWIRKTPDMFDVNKVFIIHKSANFNTNKITEKKALSKIVNKQVLATSMPGTKILAEVDRFANKFNSFFNLDFNREEKGLIRLLKSTLNEN